MYHSKVAIGPNDQNKDRWKWILNMLPQYTWNCNVVCFVLCSDFYHILWFNFAYISLNDLLFVIVEIIAVFNFHIIEFVLV